VLAATPTNPPKGKCHDRCASDRNGHTAASVGRDAPKDNHHSFTVGSDPVRHLATATPAPPARAVAPAAAVEAIARIFGTVNPLAGSARCDQPVQAARLTGSLVFSDCVAVFYSSLRLIPGTSLPPSVCRAASCPVARGRGIGTLGLAAALRRIRRSTHTVPPL
jgi:hypothetical protein